MLVSGMADLVKKLHVLDRMLSVNEANSDAISTVEVAPMKCIIRRNA